MRELGVILFCACALAFIQIKMSHAAIPLQKPSFDGKVSVEKAIQQRRTIRDFRETPLSLVHLSQLLWSAQGITDPKGAGRAAPSGGARYPLDIYVVIGKKSVENVEEGIYHYMPEKHSISSVDKSDKRDLRREMGSASLGQMWMAKAPVIFVITAEYPRITGRYGDRGLRLGETDSAPHAQLRSGHRGIRYAQIEVGHVGQNLFLQAEALGLGAGIVGAFNDAEVAKVLSVPRQHEPLLILPVGYKK
jgi:SagB-type dehydrogenase family enzyme